MKASDFDYDLPKSFIAQDPVVPRDHSRLLVYDTKRDEIFHRSFFDIKKYLGPNDVLVMNRSKVLPARILFNFDGREREIFLLKKIEDFVWQVLVRPGKLFQVGTRMVINEDLHFEVLKILDDGSRLLKFDGENLDKRLFEAGVTPLPPYICGSNSSDEQYQTVYANETGSVAAPTAGLHFTEDLLASLNKLGVNFAEVVLHVGRGTFLPVKTDNLQEHVMHEEFFFVPDGSAEILQKSLNDKKRIIAVGTTSVRVLESVGRDGDFKGAHGDTDIFIYPGKHRWQIVDGLITNFHLPKSTLMMLVASFLEDKGVKSPIKKLLELYEVAKEEGYRFYSFGDAMFIF